MLYINSLQDALGVTGSVQSTLSTLTLPWPPCRSVIIRPASKSDAGNAKEGPQHAAQRGLHGPGGKSTARRHTLTSMPSHMVRSRRTITHEPGTAKLVICNLGASVKHLFVTVPVCECRLSVSLNYFVNLAFFHRCRPCRQPCCGASTLFKDASFWASLGERLNSLLISCLTT